MEWESIDVPGWDDCTVWVKIGNVDGVRHVTSLCIEPRDPDRPRALTGRALKTLPIGSIPDMLQVLDFRLQPARPWEAAFAEARKKAEPKEDTRTATTVEEVAAVWLAAYDAGAPNKREIVCTTLNIGTRTADRYIGKARDRGLIPDDRKEGK